MYRALAYKCLQNRIEKEDEEDILKILEDTKIEYVKNSVNGKILTSIILDGKDITEEIHRVDIAQVASDISKIVKVREYMVDLQRKIANEYVKMDEDVLLEGRDICTVVFPDADLKIYLDADTKIRAKRRLEELKNRGKKDFDDYAIISLQKIENDSSWEPPFTHIIIDEAQDLNKAQILVISKLVSQETESISIIADAAQRIYISGFTWSEVGLNVRGGRTIEFKKNYRNSVHIARAALSLLENEEDKSEFTVVETALSGGEKPTLSLLGSFEEQLAYLKDELQNLKNTGKINSTIVLHRTNDGVNRIQHYLNTNGFQTELVRSNLPVRYESDSIKISTMSSVKGLEFDNVFIMDLTDEIIPYPPGFIETDDEFHISTERRLLYTCMTRARNILFLIGDKNNPSRYIAEIDANFLNKVSTLPSECALNDDYLPF